MKNKIKWGVIGSGGIARRRTIPEGLMVANNAELVAVYDINEQVNQAVASEFRVMKANSIEELLNSDIDVVYVASPVSKHLNHVVACARAGKHVLCEKPLGLSVNEAKQMIAVCRQEGAMLGVGLMMRFHAQHQAALKMISEGRLGKPVYGRAQLSCWYPPIEGAWRQNPALGGGGSLADMGSHCIDLLQMFFGKINRLSCFIRNNVHDYESEDSAVVSLDFENGAMATVDAYFCIPDDSSKNILELYGSKGSILAQGTIGQGDRGKMTAWLEEGTGEYDAQQARREGEGIVINPKPVNTYRAEIEEFSQAILEKREPANSSLLGLENMKIIEACYRSAKTGKIVEINH